jgi:D-threo-aldose 1-dehydrogenase
MIPRFVEHFDMDYFLVAMPYTLIDQQALDEEFPLCEKRDIGVIIGAPFASGILAQGTVPGARYGYQAAGDKVLQRVAQFERVCASHGVPLGAAALQFPLGHRAVASVIPGGGSEHEVRSNLEWMSASIPAALWSDLRGEGLLRDDAPVPLD